MPIKGENKSNYVPADDILFRTNGGYDAYMYYLGSVRRLMKRPWGKEERHPSWGIYPNAGIWWWKDQATEESGTIIQFVERMFNLNYKDALDKLAWDFGLSTEQGINTSPVNITWQVPDAREQEEYISIKFDTKPFQAQHHEFWNIAEVSEDWCRGKNCYALKSLAVKNQRVNIGANEVAFVYVAEGEGVKVYFPHREKRFKNNVPYHYLWNFENIHACEDLVVQKSVKDLIVTTMLTPCVIATQAEQIKIFNKDVVDKINSVSKRAWIWYGSDDDGVKKCKEITGCNSWKYINTPKKLLPDVNDTYSFVKHFNTLKMGTGLKEMEEFMKHKKLLK